MTWYKMTGLQVKNIRMSRTISRHPFVDLTRGLERKYSLEISDYFSPLIAYLLYTIKYTTALMTEATTDVSNTYTAPNPSTYKNVH